jgi:hypothetical protein
MYGNYSRFETTCQVKYHKKPYLSSVFTVKPPFLKDSSVKDKMDNFGPKSPPSNIQLYQAKNAQNIDKNALS